MHRHFGLSPIFLLMIFIPVAEGITGKFVLFLFSHIVGLGEWMSQNKHRHSKRSLRNYCSSPIKLYPFLRRHQLFSEFLRRIFVHTVVRNQFGGQSVDKSYISKSPIIWSTNDWRFTKVVPLGLEPRTPWLWVRCSDQLSYRTVLRCKVIYFRAIVQIFFQAQFCCSAAKFFVLAYVVVLL